MSGDCDGSVHPPPGMAGAPPGQVGSIFMVRAGKKERDIFRTLDMGDMYPGDLLITRTSGGAGWGHPAEPGPGEGRVERDGRPSLG